MNNVEKTIRNSVISVLAQICTLLLQFINRRVFIIFLNIEYLGYQTIFGNVFSLLSVAELGIGNIITFHLYREIINGNKHEIGKLMYIYKWLYRVVAVLVAIAGVGCFFLLPFFIKDASVSWSYLHIVYLLQLSSVVLGYFLSYKRTIYIATQQEYKCVKIDLYVNVFVQVIQLILLAIFKNYILYLCLQLSITLIANIIISILVDKDYPYIKGKFVVSKDELKKRNMFSDMGNFLIHQISYAIFGGTDNIIISAFCGVRQVALYGNYLLVQKGVMQVLFYKLLNPIQATIGNIIYSERKKSELWEQFNILDIFSFYFASYVGLGFFTFYQPFIQIWMGKDYLLDFSFVIVFSLYIYLGAVFEIIYKYRCTFGDYKQDRWFMVLSAILNIVISIPGAILYGVTGVVFGTLIAYIPIAMGRIRFVIKNYFSQSMIKYILRHVCLLVVVALEATAIFFITYNLPVNFMGILIRLIMWLLIPLVINTVINIKNSYFKSFLKYIWKAVKIITNKLKKGEKK